MGHKGIIRLFQWKFGESESLKTGTPNICMQQAQDQHDLRLLCRPDLYDGNAKVKHTTQQAFHSLSSSDKAMTPLLKEGGLSPHCHLVIHLLNIVLSPQVFMRSNIDGSHLLNNVSSSLVTHHYFTTVNVS